jgi:hypothetical protein
MDRHPVITRHRHRGPAPSHPVPGIRGHGSQLVVGFYSSNPGDSNHRHGGAPIMTECDEIACGDRSRPPEPGAAVNRDPLASGNSGNNPRYRGRQLLRSWRGKVTHREVTFGESMFRQPFRRMRPQVEVDQLSNPPLPQAGQVAIFPGIGAEQNLAGGVNPGSRVSENSVFAQGIPEPNGQRNVRGAQAGVGSSHGRRVDQIPIRTGVPHGSLVLIETLPGEDSRSTGQFFKESLSATASRL